MEVSWVKIKRWVKKAFRILEALAALATIIGMYFTFDTWRREFGLFPQAFPSAAMPSSEVLATGLKLSPIFNVVLAVVLPVLIMIGVVVSAIYLGILLEYRYSRKIHLNRVSGLIGGFLSFAFVTLAINSPAIQKALDFQMDPFLALISAAPLGITVGFLSCFLGMRTYMDKDNVFAVILGVWIAIGLTGLYLYAVSDESFRLLLAGLFLGFLIGVIWYVGRFERDVTEFLIYNRNAYQRNRRSQ